ncbi:GntR family transcriptional regulator [Rubellimicrobium roseum]|uniref:GntR family transcriptional regulator n=1 Tax=Rubellimicrobium roseum TaxID=687525 RepID=A0A5C4N7K4_9RHOB|nr:GntR family transcriptional regulator [Rubellimicrobium roseum]TNC64218.1 GntR family transcriptional regulator [Rubellimicrobium roseum]
MTFRTASVELIPPPRLTDQVFTALYDRIVQLELLPGTKISEGEIAEQFDVSRQPVRDAFFRLSQIGLLIIRPQRATIISPIQAEAVLQARYIRTAIEVETIRIAAQGMPDRTLDDLDRQIEEQDSAVRQGVRRLFHDLDDKMHRTIFEAAGKGFAWALVRDNKAHMDRIRYISLENGAQRAFDEHLGLMEALRAHKPDLAETRMREHLGRISVTLEKAIRERPELFRAT